MNVTLRTIALVDNSLPTAGAPDRSVVTILSTPFGMPARSASSASANAEKGVCSAGFNTIVQPAARAGATLRVIIAFGKFHGVMAAQTPIGCLITTSRLSP